MVTTSFPSGGGVQGTIVTMVTARFAVFEEICDQLARLLVPVQLEIVGFRYLAFLKILSLMVDPFTVCANDRPVSVARESRRV